MASNRLQINAAKTEVLWSASTRQQHLVPSDPFSVCGDTVNPAKSVRDLEIFLDSAMPMKTHVSRTVSSCCAALRQIRSTGRSISEPVLLSLVTSLVLPLLDYGSVNLIGIYIDACRIVSNQCLTRQQDWCATTENTTILHFCRVVCTDCASQNVLRSVWLFLCSAAAVARHQNTWRETCSGQLTKTHVSDSDLRRVTNWSSGAPD